ncbi:MAG TPA: 50S ribosomal protein L22 [Candidatus Paceibacterota bacterium]|nr:50S ribosomal protein L22 [Candidatus Paceibacterota bacterium]
MTEAKATLSNYRQSPRKVRLIADLIRGKSAAQAINILGLLPKRGAEPMLKLVKSAVANAKEGSAEQLFVSAIQVNGGVVLKRMMPRARGRGFPIKKRTSHITLSLSQKPAKEATKK